MNTTDSVPEEPEFTVPWKHRILQRNKFLEQKSKDATEQSSCGIDSRKVRIISRAEQFVEWIPEK